MGISFESAGSGCAAVVRSLPMPPLRDDGSAA
jgi:hypothetical protein